MWWHDLRLAWLSMQRNPFVAALIVAVIAVGVGTSIVAITLYHAKSGNPIWWKNDVLYRVMVDSRVTARSAISLTLLGFCSCTNMMADVRTFLVSPPLPTLVQLSRTFRAHEHSLRGSTVYQSPFGTWLLDRSREVHSY